ncbi:hypothetical protein SAMN06295937_100135 [Sphingopyxis flava]|uniref:Uncharacterized protein n=1 Tax=Sphingopyxis flava TaxID=1507287 RepID=A0A1T4ZR45_9SPHN|nr:hypothetical protein SAMN06295937_100135 [Sphingopyxis flava]
MDFEVLGGGFHVESIVRPDVVEAVRDCAATS